MRFNRDLSVTGRVATGHPFPALGNQQGEEGQAESRAEKGMGTERGLSWRLALVFSSAGAVAGLFSVKS